MTARQQTDRPTGRSTNRPTNGHAGSQGSFTSNNIIRYQIYERNFTAYDLKKFRYFFLTSLFYYLSIQENFLNGQRQLHCHAFLSENLSIKLSIDCVCVQVSADLVPVLYHEFNLCVQVIKCRYTGCSLNIVFFSKILTFSGLWPFLFSLGVSVFTRTRQVCRTPALQQNWQSSEKFKNFKEKTR